MLGLNNPYFPNAGWGSNRNRTGGMPGWWGNKNAREWVGYKQSVSQAEQRRSMVSDLLKQYGQGRDRAEQANEGRYQEILQGYGQRRDEGLAALQGAGAQERSDITRTFQNQGTRATQDMVSRGLTGSTIPASVQSGINRRMSDAMGSLNDRLIQQRVGIMGDYDRQRLEFMERKEDRYPKLSDLAQIIAMYGGQAQGG